MLAHIAEGAGAGTVVFVAIIRLIAYAIDDDKRWRRFRTSPCSSCSCCLPSPSP